MSAYENVVAGKLRLKGKALDVRDSDIKKRKKHKDRNVQSYHVAGHDRFTDIQNGGEYDQDERLTPAERRYMKRLQKIKLKRLANAAMKSHRDRIQEINQHLANLSEHYDIPKVEPN